MYNTNGIDSKFRLAILVARRAKQLIGGSKRKVEVKAENVLTVAMEEFKQGKIDFDILHQDQTLLDEEKLKFEAEAGSTSEEKLVENLEAIEDGDPPQPEI